MHHQHLRTLRLESNHVPFLLFFFKEFSKFGYITISQVIHGDKILYRLIIVSCPFVPDTRLKVGAAKSITMVSLRFPPFQLSIYCDAEDGPFVKKKQHPAVPSDIHSEYSQPGY